MKSELGEGGRAVICTARAHQDFPTTLLEFGL